MFHPAHWYLPALNLHQLAVTLSITLFTARNIGVMLKLAWPMTKFWRMTSVWIDVVLLTSGIMLWVILAYNPAQQFWLGTKMLLLVLYIVLGSFALKRGKTPAVRFVFFVLALITVFTMVSIALTRQPAGWMGLL